MGLVPFRLGSRVRQQRITAVNEPSLVAGIALFAGAVSPALRLAKHAPSTPRRGRSGGPGDRLVFK